MVNVVTYQTIVLNLGLGQDIWMLKPNNITSIFFVRKDKQRAECRTRMLTDIHSTSTSVNSFTQRR